MAEPDALYGTTLSVESMKVIAESIGVGALPDDAAKELADDVSFKISKLVTLDVRSGFIDFSFRGSWMSWASGFIGRPFKTLLYTHPHH